jgi:Phytanoyl-CoA dioxygenase (PhyH)
MSFTPLSQEQLLSFHKDGYFVIKQFCSTPEVNKLCSAAIPDADNPGSNQDLNSHFSKKSKVSLWFSPNNDVFGYLSRSEKIVHTIAQLLEGYAPVCHIQSKIMEKKPRIGGNWAWHQDYAYWSENKFLKASQMVNVMVSLTGTNKESGCSQVIKGSHKLSRIKHKFGGEQPGADMIKVSEALQSMEMVYMEVEAGDAIFFHSNLLHRADANESERSRWSIVSCYAALSSLSEKPPFTSWYTPVSVVPDEAILEGEEQSIDDNSISKERMKVN